MARVELSETWVCGYPLEEVAAVVKGYLEKHNVRYEYVGEGQIEGRQGSQFVTRLYGGWWVDPKFYPKKIGLGFREVEHGIEVDARLEEALGIGLIDSVFRKQYEEYFRAFLANLKFELGAGEGDADLSYPVNRMRSVQKVPAITSVLVILIVLVGMFANPVSWGNPIPVSFKLEGVEWSKVWRGPGEVRVEDVQIGDNGDLYLTGSKTRIADLNAGWGMQFLWSSGSGQKNYMRPTFGFIAAMSESGVLNWAVAAPGIHDAMAIDADGNMYLTGRISETSDFDPGPGEEIYTPHFAGCCCDGDNYLVKYGPNGQYCWVQTWIGSECLCGNSCIMLGPDGDIYMAGIFEGSVDFRTENEETQSHLYIASSREDVYLFRFNRDGQPVWLRSFGGDGDDYVFDMAIDWQGNVYLVGTFAPRGMDFDPDLEIVTPSLIGGSHGGFITKFDSDGNHQWVVVYDDVSPKGLGVDASGGVCVAGSVEGRADLDPGPETDMHGTAGNRDDACFIRLTSEGEYVWGTAWGGPDVDRAYDVVVDSEGNAYVSGVVDLPEFGIGFLQLPRTSAFLCMIGPDGDIEWSRTSEQWSTGEGVLLQDGNAVYMFGRFGLGASFLARIPCGD